MTQNKIIDSALEAPKDAIRRTLAAALREARPGAYICFFDFSYHETRRFCLKGNGALTFLNEFDQDFERSVHRGVLTFSSLNGWWTLTRNEQTMEIVQITISGAHGTEQIAILISETPELAHEYLLAQEEFSNRVDGAVLVFQDGCWRFDEDLYSEIQSSTFDNIVLPEGLQQNIISDVQQWLGSQALYEQHGIPWKRGMILVGPPGNGKTHLIKSLVNHFKLNALYVRGFSAPYRSDSSVISAVFERARSTAPCMLILEDLDTLITPKNRSHFLNEMDGFAVNSGILVVASANDPARLDPALVNRPSRFDRRYVFSLPELTERSRYLIFFTSHLDPSLRLSEKDAENVGRGTEGFSYAYLKELVLSSMMSWISAGKTEDFVACMMQNVEPLRDQMNFEATLPPPEKEEQRRYPWDMFQESED